MKIEKLYLKNFKIFHSLNKPVIDLDFSTFTNPITLIIGKMGSGKTALLGQLQPSAGYGNLDIRGHESPIMEGMNGEKRIVISDEDTIFDIRHVWNWNKSTLTHNRKSYIAKNGVELNENGNVSSYETLQYYELGIDQTYLKLIRIGPNVINIPNQKDSDRKSSFASFIPSVDVYSAYYKGMTQELRTTNTKVSLLANKLSSLTNQSGLEIDDQFKEIDQKVKDDEKEYQSIMKEKYLIEAKIDSILQGLSVADLKGKIKNIGVSIENLSQEILDMQRNIESISTYYGTPEELQQKIGELRGRESYLREFIESSSKSHQEMENKSNSLLYKIQSSGNSDRIKKIQKTYDDISQMIERYQSELSGFHCDYDLDTIYGLTEKLITFKQLINDLKNYNLEDVEKIYNGNQSILKYATHRIDSVRKEINRLEIALKNYEFSKGYQTPCILHTPPECPTDTCLYYRTHPDTIKRSQSASVDKLYIDSKAEISKLEIMINRFHDYPTIYGLLQSVKLLWKQLQPILYGIGALNEDSLLKIITTLIGRLDWYDTAVISDTIEKLEKQNKFREMVSKAKEMKEELDLYALNDINKLEEEYQVLQESMNSIMAKIIESKKDLDDIIAEQESLNQFYLALTKSEVIKSEIEQKKKSLEELGTLKDESIKQYDVVVSYMNDLTQINMRLVSYEGLLRDDKKQLERLKSIMDNIISTKKEYEEAIKEQFYQKMICKSVSTSKGIPIYMMQELGETCKDHMNELLANAMGNQIEIQDFIIDEDRFLIPYTVNGILVNDVSKASQGQTSFIDLALSFSLMQLAPHKYNIPLLDEVDGALYTSDRNHIISIILGQMRSIKAEQLFFVSHNNTWDGYPVNVIMTTDENIERTEMMNIVRI